MATKEEMIPTEDTTGMKDRKTIRLARIAGVFYLLVGIFGGFAEGFVDPKMYVAGNAAATAGNVLANSGLVRMSVVAHLLDAIFFVLTAMTLYILLQHVHKSVARAMLVFVALAVGIITLNAVFQFEGLQVATDSFLCGRLRRRGVECARAAPARHPALWDPQRAGLLWPVAGAARVSRLQIRAVPQGAGRRARRGHRLLPGGPARGVPGPRLRQADPPVHCHRARHRGDLDGPVPARGWREDREARQANPCLGRSVNATAHCGVINEARYLERMFQYQGN